MKNKILILVLLMFNFTSNIYGDDKLYEKIDLFGEVLEKIKQEYVDEIDQADVMDSAINGVLQSLDPYSAYMSPELFKSMQTESKGEFGGLGIEIGMEAGVVKVIAPISDTPAEKAGIKAGDYIVRINDIQVQGKSLMEAVKLMRGPVGSSIELMVRRKGIKKPLSFKIQRKIIEVKSVKAKILGIKNNIGYIKLKSFNENSDKQFVKEIKNYENASEIEREALDEIAQIESDGKHKSHLAYIASLQVQQNDELAQLERQKSEKKSFFESMSNKLSELTGIELPDFADVKETFSSIGDEFKRRGDALKVSLSEAKDSIVDGLENIGDKFTDLTGIEIPTMQGMKDKLTDTKNSVLNFLGLKSEEDIAEEKRDRAISGGIGGPDDIGVAEQTQERLFEEKEANAKELKNEKNKLITLNKERSNLQIAYNKLSRARDMARATGEEQFTSGYEATMANTDMNMSHAERKFHSSFITTRSEDEISEEMKKIDDQFKLTTAARKEQKKLLPKARKKDKLKRENLDVEISNIDSKMLDSKDIESANADVEAARLEKLTQDNRRSMLGGLEGPATLATSQRDVIENLVSQDDIDKMRDKVTKINEIIKDGITSEEKTQLADLGVVVTGQGGRRGERRIINLAVQEAVRTRDEMLTANAELNASRDQTANVQNMIAPQINNSSNNQSVVTPIIHHNTEPPAGSSLPMAFR